MVTCWLVAGALLWPSATAQSRPTGVRHLACGPYRIVVSPAGHIRSLRVGRVEFLQPLPGRLDGTGLRGRAGWVAPRLTVQSTSDHGLSFTSADLRIRYDLGPDGVDLVIVHRMAEVLVWHVRPGSRVTQCVGARPGNVVDPVAVGRRPQRRSRWVTREGPALIMPDGQWTRLGDATPPVATYTVWLPARTEVRLHLSPVPWLSGPDALAVHVQADPPDFLLPADPSAGFSCRVVNLGDRPLDVLAGWSLTELVLGTAVELKPPTQAKLTVRARGHGQWHIGLPRLKPGVYETHLNLMDPKGKAQVIDWVFGYELAKWRPGQTRPPDFGRFWADTLDQLRRTPIDARVVPVGHPRYTGARLFKVSLGTLGGTRCTGWLSVPAGPIPFPAVLVLPRGGVRPIPPPVPNDKAVVFALAVHGFDVDLSDAPDEPPWPGWRYQVAGLSRPDTSFLRTVYASCVRAMDFLVGRPEVDRARIAVTGTGQGGALALVCAALDARVGLCAPAHSDLCRLEWSTYHTGGGPVCKADKPRARTHAQFRRTLSYLDVANFAPMIRCPVVEVVGLADRRFPPAGQLAALAAVTAPKRILAVPLDDDRSHRRAVQQQHDAVVAFLRAPTTQPTR